MSTSKQNTSDVSNPVSDPETSGPERGKEQSSIPSTDTQNEKNNTQTSSKTRSHDNDDATQKPTDVHLLPKEDSKESEKEKSPNIRSITAPSNKVTPLLNPSKDKQRNENIRSTQSKDSKVTILEDLGDSDSSTTPLISTKTISRVPDSGSLIEMERLPQSLSTKSEKAHDNEEVGERSLEPKDTPEITESTTQEKKMLSAREKFFENKSPLERTTSTPTSRVRHRDIPHDHLSPVREFKTLKSYEKAGQTPLEELVNSLEMTPENLTKPFLEIEEIANDKETAADEKELQDDTGETIMHHLAKEGQVEVLRKILDLEERPKIKASTIVEAIITRDKAGWSPLMAAMKSERNVNEVLDLFLRFLETHATTEHVDKMTEVADPENPTSDNIFTLLISSHTCGSFDNIQILFNMLVRKRDSTKKLNTWLIRIIEELSKANSCDLGAKEMRRVIDLLLKSAVIVKKENDAKMKNNPTPEPENDFKKRIISDFLKHKDEDGHNILMILAKHTMDGALREILTNDNTIHLITHSLLSERSKLRQTVMSIVEVNRADMAESLALLLKIEFGCHAGDLTQAEICLSGQLETSISSSEILKGLHQLQPLTWCQKFTIWAVLFLTWLVPNYGLTAFDWFSDGYLCYEYWNEWTNDTLVNVTNFKKRCELSSKTLKHHWDIVNVTVSGTFVQSCTNHNYSAEIEKLQDLALDTHCVNESFSKNVYDPSTYCLNESISLSRDLKYECLYDPCDPLDAYGDCLGGQSKFFYTLIPIIGPVFLYLFEFLVLTEEFEPTGLRRRIKDTWNGLVNCKSDANYKCYSPILSVLSLIRWIFLAILAVIFWMPVSAWCKYRSDGKYETASGMKKVKMRRNKRCMDLAASRGELMEASIEDVFEPMIQGYIMFPGMISIIKRINNSVKMNPNGSISLDFTLSTLELGQIFSVTISMICLAWIFSEYASVRKNMYLDPSESPFSRIIMWFFMLCQIIARLFAFLLFTLYFDPGNFYPLMIFILVHMILAGTLHVIFSEDLMYLRRGKYIKFFHNVTFNALCSIYFHSYIQQDEGYDSKLNAEKHKKVLCDPNDVEKCTNVRHSKNIKIEHSNQHTSTLLRQVMYDVLYAGEYAVLLGFGFHSRPFKDTTSPLFCTDLYIEITIIVLYITALALRITYYTVMHVWSNVIWSSKRLRRVDFDKGEEDDVDNKNRTEIGAETERVMIRTHKKFFRYVFICRNTWILGKVKNVEITLAILPKWIIDNMRSWGENVLFASEHIRDDVRLYFAKFRCSCPDILINILKGFLMLLVFLIVFVVFNILVLAILLVLLFLTLPVIFVLFLINIRKGFVSETEEDTTQDILEEPPDINQEIMFEVYPNITLFSIQQSLLNNDGTVNLRNREKITAKEFRMLSHKLLALNNLKYPLKVIDLTDCCVTDEEMKYLAPLLAKFEKVILNGTQSLTNEGFETLKKVLYRMSVIPTSVKLKVLELKIQKRKGDIVKEGRGLLLGQDLDGKIEMDNFLSNEFEGLAMDGRSLLTISKFLPRLEELHLDGVFLETKIFTEMREKAEKIHAKSKTIQRQLTLSKESEKYIETKEQLDAEGHWKVVSKTILDTPESKRKLKCFSINGCQIDDVNLGVLAPALVTVERLHIADNPDITGVGWKNLRENMKQSSAFNFLSVKVSERSKKTLIKNDPEMLPHLVELLSQLQRVDISGQKEVTNEIVEQLKELSISDKDGFKLEAIIVSRAYYKPNSMFHKNLTFEIEFSDSYKDGEPRWKRNKLQNNSHSTSLNGTKDQMNMIADA